MSTAAGSRKKHSKLHNEERADITKDEFEAIREALSKEEFRKLFFDYVEEVQDPENRKIYEQEITQLEKERGVDIKFVHPKPGFVVKTSIDGELKCFINIASSPEVARPNSEVGMNPETGGRGLSWSIPMAQTGGRDDCDAKNNHCKVFDVVFHPDALHLSTRDSQFRKALIDTALDAVEREYEVALDRANLKYPKLDYKGIARPTVIRKLAANPTPEEQEPHPLEHMYPTKPPASNSEPKILPMKTKAAPVPEFAVPKYSIKQSHDVDLSEYTDELDAKLHVTVPRSLVVEIELPLLRSTAECQLDVTAKSVYLLSERLGAKYRLKLDLPFVVDDKAGNARFDTEKRRLSITLPVVRKSVNQQRQMHDTLRYLSREDSGVELHSNSESPVEDDADGDMPETPELETAAPPDPPALTPSTFLKDSVHYQLPKFDCNALDNAMAFVLDVAHVQPDSIVTLKTDRSVSVKFATIGSGYYPTHYAFYMELPSVDMEEYHKDHCIESIEAEAWDNNVIMKLFLGAESKAPTSYLAGLHANGLKEYQVYGHYKAKTDKNNECEPNPPRDVQIMRTDDAVVITVRPPHTSITTEEDEEQQQQLHKKPSKKQRKRNKKQRSYSESACEEMLDQQDGPLGRKKDATTPMVPQRKQRSYSECNDSTIGSENVNRGILKRFSRYGPRPSMSDSCSSIDDCGFSSHSCSVDASSSLFSQSFNGIPEEDRTEEGLSESCKKTVRFNDQIMKQVFRHDSSILGQRKKNQKRRNCKLRAQQRRLSEGDSADYEETRDTALKQQGEPSGNKLHDSGLDLTGASASHRTDNNSKSYRTRQDHADADAKNDAMMFEMDDEDDEI
ncbi:protein kintoun isoform X1 [Drosophila pseudoobscura]|uniref:protein kintoun isoform X1 n=1 Tax=Drosophila pseudoobscura TaxID=7237 RepID=UPI00143F89F7|nr:protein kintoun isoform X1 [Drosophila pseudoobscura]XP_015039219.2 protein kintoun isoform X1 [Drosophila pseudoobscura]